MKISSLEVVQWGFSIWVTWSCVQYMRSGDLKQDFGVFRSHSPLTWAKILGGCVAMLAVVFVVLVSLILAWPRVMGATWLDLLARPGENSKVGNLNLAGASIPFFGIVFVILLWLNLPRLARYEEEWFRDGTRDWAHAIPRSLKFGFIHCVVGVPVAGGFALALMGLWLTYQYFKGGVERSTLYHATQNMLLMSFVFVGVVLMNIGMIRL